MTYYQSLESDNWKKSSYVKFKEFISDNPRLNKTKKQLILKLVEILESPRPDGVKKIDELEELMTKMQTGP